MKDTLLRNTLLIGIIGTIVMCLFPPMASETATFFGRRPFSDYHFITAYRGDLDVDVAGLALQIGIVWLAAGVYYIRRRSGVS